MTAYARTLIIQCSRCPMPAAKEVFNSKNASMGIFCSRCAAAEVERLNAGLQTGAP